MTQQQAAAIVMAINSIQRFVPPYLFAELAQACTPVADIANGRLVCETRPVASPPTEATER